MNGMLKLISTSVSVKELHALAKKHTLIKQGEGHWRCFVRGAVVDIEQDGNMLTVGTPLDLALKTDRAARNAYAFSSHLEKFEHRWFVPHVLGERHGRRWERGSEMCVSYSFNSETLEAGELAEIVAESAFQGEHMRDVVAELSAGEMGLASAVKTVDGLWQLKCFVERTKEQGGRNLVKVEEEELPIPPEPIDVRELYPRVRPASILDTKVVELKTTTVGDAAGVLRVGGKAFPVSVSYRAPYVAEVQVAVVEKVGESCNRVKAALEVAKRVLGG